MKDVSGVLASSRGQALKLIAITQLPSEFHQDVNRIAAAFGRKPSKLVNVSALTGELHELTDGIVIASGCPDPQLAQVFFRHPLVSRAAYPPIPMDNVDLRARPGSAAPSQALTRAAERQPSGRHSRG